MKPLLDKGLAEEILKGNSNLVRYVVNRIHRMKRCNVWIQ